MDKEVVENLQVKRKKTKIERDISRVITRPNIPGRLTRVSQIINRVLSLNNSEAADLYSKVSLSFSSRHKDLERILIRHFNTVSEHVPDKENLGSVKKLLIGAYFTMEYSIESAAIFNPSIIPHPDQEGVEPGHLRFIMSFRATGEGHISSIVFRSGIIDESSILVFDPISKYLETPDILHDQYYDRHLFKLKLKDMDAWNEASAQIFENTPEHFTFNELRKKIDTDYLNLNDQSRDEAIKNINWLAHSNYFIKFDKEIQLSERVIFPVSENESRGIEDARFVRFTDDNGAITYYATYTAYNGKSILPQLLATEDFLSFDITTLNGKAAHNKGMALFPRKINGQYAMLSRQDGENNYIMFSDNLHFWEDAHVIQEPAYPWEFIQIGNCGSPIETDEGWLVLTHGVGPLRQYSIGAILLDRENPEKIIGRLREPLISPQKEEREGYVPNVVYSCGSLIHNGMLIIPYAMSDIASGIANIRVNDLIDRIKSQP